MQTSYEERKRYKKHYVFITITVILLISIFLLNLWFFRVKSIVENDLFYSGIYIEDLPLGKMSYEDAETMIHEKLNINLKEKLIQLAHGEKQWEYSYEDLNVQYELDDILEKAYSIGRDGKLLERYKVIKQLSKNPKNFHISYAYDEERLKKILEEISQEVDVDAKDAKIQRLNNEFVIHSEVTGKKLDVEKSLEIIKKQMDEHKDGIVELIVKEDSPKLYKNQLTTIKEKINEFSTYFNAGDVGRTENLRVASQKINGTILMPGEIFSLNKVLGERNEANGYKPAKVIIDNELVDGMAGGICQVATTLYNTTLFSEMEIVERRPHSLRVGYVDAGRDATIADNYIDFKFKNNYDTPIFIEAGLQGNTVKVSFYGQKKYNSNRKVSYQSEIIEKIPPGEDEIIKDPTLLEGQVEILRKPIEGLKVRLYKIVEEDGKVVERQPVDISYYAPVKGKRKIGTKKIMVNKVDSNDNKKDNKNTKNNIIESTEVKPNDTNPNQTNKPIETTEENIVESNVQ